MPNQSSNTPFGRLKVHFEESCGATLRNVIRNNSAYFTEADALSADIVLFGTDAVPDIRASNAYRTYPHKCMCVTESDIPTFRLRGLYAANSKSFLTNGRTRTVNYFLSERERGNPAIRALVGQRVEKRYLYSFMGGSNSWARKRLLKYVPSRSDTVVEATDAYNHWTDKRDPDHAQKAQMRYANVIASSKFILCPRGCGLSSYRLFEAMLLSVAPVIISDKWKPLEEIDWSFALFIPERHIRRVDEIVRSHESEWEQRGEAANRAYRQFFTDEVIGQTLHRKFSGLIAEYNPATEPLFAAATETRAAVRQAYWDLYRVAKRVIFRTLHATGIPFPFPLHEPVAEQIGKGGQR